MPPRPAQSLGRARGRTPALRSPPSENRSFSPCPVPDLSSNVVDVNVTDPSGEEHAMNIIDAIDAEVAYRRERVTQHFRPWRRVGAERRSSSRGSARDRRLPAVAASVITISR